MKSTPFYYNMMPLGVQTGQVLCPGQCTVSTFIPIGSIYGIYVFSDILEDFLTVGQKAIHGLYGI